MEPVVDHVNLVVSDLDPAVAFFRDLLGFAVTLEVRLEGEWIEQVTGIPGAVADCVYLQPVEGTRIELLCYRTPAGAGLPDPSLPNGLGLRHVAFRVKGIEEWHRRLSAAGCRVISPPVEVPLARVSQVGGRKLLFYFVGPEGVLLEMAEFIPN
jgi:catechol 2,3-dioxygenase-like lactoylglutathione lyase family enzyme